MFSPIIINWVVASGPWFGIIPSANNDWIGFFGDYLGSAITAGSLIITILYTTWQYKDQDRKRIQPYLSIKQLHKSKFLDETINITTDQYRIGAIGLFSEKNKAGKDGGIYFESLELHGEVSNIGIGTAINISIKDISIENRIFMNGNTLHAMNIGDIAYFRIIFNDIFLASESLSDIFINSQNDSRETSQEIPRLKMKFKLIYSDMLGNNYTQNALVDIQVIKERSSIVYPNILFQNMTFPELIKK